MQRIKSLLTYHQLLVARLASTTQISDPIALFVEFCDEVYSKQSLLADYIHYITKHSDSASRSEIVSDLQCECPLVEQCARTQRHCRERGRGKDKHSNFFIDTFDTIHFHLFHLEHVGLRDADDAKADDDAQEDEEGIVVVDADTRRIADAIAKRVSKSALHRIDGTKNSKFNALGGNVLQEDSGGGTWLL